MEPSHLFYLENMFPFFVSCEVGQMENISPGQIIDEPIRPVNIPRKEKDFQGMLEYKKEDEQKLVKNLILGKYFLHRIKGLSGTYVSSGRLALSFEIVNTNFSRHHYRLCITCFGSILITSHIISQTAGIPA